MAHSIANKAYTFTDNLGTVVSYSTSTLTSLLPARISNYAREYYVGGGGDPCYYDYYAAVVAYSALLFALYIAIVTCADPLTILACPLALAGLGAAFVAYVFAVIALEVCWY